MIASLVHFFIIWNVLGLVRQKLSSVSSSGSSGGKGNLIVQRVDTTTTAIPVHVHLICWNAKQ